jgi:uncharacterized RDD family membrane protein YckC
MIYEALLVFGIFFFADWVFDVLTHSRHALVLRAARQAWLFVVIGWYFSYFWLRKGQTLAMQTWRIQLVAKPPGRLNWPRVMLRYVLAWLWFLPGLIVAYALHVSAPLALAIVALGILLWGATMFLDKERQFLHDRLAGTRLVLLPGGQKRQATEATPDAAGQTQDGPA